MSNVPATRPRAEEETAEVTVTYRGVTYRAKGVIFALDITNEFEELDKNAGWLELGQRVNTTFTLRLTRAEVVQETQYQLPDPAGA